MRLSTLLPRPNRQKKQHRIVRQGDIEVIQAEVFGYDGAFEAPGGGGGYQALFKQNTKEYIYKKIEQRTKDIHNLENKLEHIREAIRARNIGSISFEKGQQYSESKT